MDGFKQPKQQTQQPPPIDSAGNQPGVVGQNPEQLRHAPGGHDVVQSETNEPEPMTQSTKLPKRRHHKRRPAIWMMVLGVLILAAASGYLWYSQQLKPVDIGSDAKQQFIIDEGASFTDAAARLENQGLIRNSFVFNLSARLNNKTGAIKAGTCSLTPALSSNDILEKITSGCQDFRSVTFYPGATIEKPFYKSPSATLSQTLYVKNVLKEAGYTDENIQEALEASYEGPLFAGKPADTTLEGYIYGETYFVNTDATAETVLRTAFEEMYKTVEEYELPQAYQKQGLENLYEGITMASIVQRELNCEDKPTQERKDRCYEYQRTIAQVLLKRLREGIPLGADVTFIYAADMAQQQPTIDFDSPYNTRTNKGLPPGPIGAPGELALRATASPSDTDYLYFVAGDDGLIYFSKTLAEHERNTKEHCQKLCFELE